MANFIRTAPHSLVKFTLKWGKAMPFPYTYEVEGRKLVLGHASG